jgi:outer membrane protein assembly factor BamB
MLSRVRILSLMAVALVCSAGSAIAQVGNQYSIPSRKLLDRYNLEQLWMSHAVINASRDRITNLVLDEETVYVQTENGFITALDSRTGAQRWAQLLARIDTPQFPLISNSNTVLVNAGMSMFAVDKWSGSELWNVNLPEQVSTSPTMDEERAFLATGSGSVYAFDLAKVHELYSQNRLPAWGFQARLWRHKTSKAIRFSPLSYDGQITFASETKTIYSVNAADDSLVYQMETPQTVTAPMVRSGDKLFVATGDQRLYCLNAQRGTTIWIFIARAEIPDAPSLINHRCYVSPNDGSLHCVNMDTGVELWEQHGAKHVLAVTQDYVISEDNLGNVLLLSPNEAENEVRIVAKIPMRDFSIRTENELTDRVYLATPSGLVICLKEKGISFPKFFKNPDKRPLEPIFIDDKPETAAESK